MRISFDNVDEFITVFNGNRYLVLFDPEKYNAIYNRIRYPINEKNGVTYLISHTYAKVKIDSYDSLPLQKTFWIML